MAAIAAEIPDNVPRDIVVDFDLFAFGDAPEGIQLAMAKLHKGPDIVWTPHNGGHWIATRAADIEAIQQDYAHFSQRQFTVPRNQVDPLALPMGIDPPEHTPYRRVLMEFLTPRAVKALGDVARDTARELVANIAPRGKCEFVEEFAKVLPIHVFLGMVNLPFEDKAYLLPLAEVSTPRLNQNACEELLRRFGLVNTARVLTMDYAYKGNQFRKDDLILIPKCLYALDDRVNTNPAEVDFHRLPSTIKHTSFGSGPHTCAGAVLARREIMVFFDEWLSVIPDFELDPDDKVVMASGSVNGVLRLPLRWEV